MFFRCDKKKCTASKRAHQILEKHTLYFIFCLLYYLTKYENWAWLLAIVWLQTVKERLYPLFYTRMRLGEFDPPDMNPYSALDLSSVQSQEHRDLAVEAAVKSFVLLKNLKDTLPLDFRGIKGKKFGVGVYLCLILYFWKLQNTNDYMFKTCIKVYVQGTGKKHI